MTHTAEKIPSGRIILLNGTSSSGKTTLAKTFQRIMDEPYLLIGIDTFVFALPGQYLNPPLWHQVFEYICHDDGSLDIQAGSLGHQLVSGMHQAIAALARTGSKIVVDHVLLDPRWLAECAAVFADFDVLMVGVRCPLEVVEQRERERNDRTLGQARAQYHRVHAYAIYDVEVDTSALSASVCAEAIKQHLSDNRPRTALKQLGNSLDYEGK